MMKTKRLFPLLLCCTLLSVLALDMAAGPKAHPLSSQWAPPDTVVYTKDNYKTRRVGNFEAVAIADSLLGGPDSLVYSTLVDTIPVILARDTIKVPDSLQFTDPFRYKYYIALVDSLTHREVSDSLRASGDSLLLADAFRLDSLYFADSLVRAKIAFENWYASLSKEERKKYDFEQKELRKKERSDSLRFIKEEKQAIKDSITQNKPRILESSFVPDSMHYKRIIAWKADRDFQDLDVFIPDTSYNYHFYDYNFQREDVNATWLGVAGSPVQTYNFFKRKKSGVSFYDALEPWTYNPETMVQYNSKTPYTELAYFGTLLSTDEKESDNLHIFTTQNVTPEFNYSILLERWGGGGMLINEETANKTAAVGINYLGKNYLLNAGYIGNTLSMGENGGLLEIKEIRDTSIESREVKVAMSSAKSTSKKRTFYVDQQLRIPFEFINRARLKKDSTYVAGDDITTAFVGHSLEASAYHRLFENGSTADSLGKSLIDNKIYLRLQPWSSESFISRIDIGIGDQIDRYHYVSESDTSRLHENSLYTYAGAKGRIGKMFDWQAKAHYSLAGYNAGDFDLNAGAAMRFYPFRKARTSPVELSLGFSSELLTADFYQRHMYSTIDENLRWDNNFKKVSTSKLQAGVDIPHWGFSLQGGYSLIGNSIYYDPQGIVRQSSELLSVLSAELDQKFTIANVLHLDHRILAQYSSDQQVLPLPGLALNLKYYVQFPVQPGVMDMQLGVNAWWNSKWYSPQWNWISGVYTTQNEWQYNNGPIFDVFVNVQWKTCCLFIKAQNLGRGWPMDHADYFSAHRHIVTTGFTPSLKLGIFWPFYVSPVQNKKVR
ncbi:MAG: putative porin [Candidatus Cryptobacteroides sp.]